MWVFWLIVVVMLLIGGWFILPAMLGYRRLRDEDRTAQNVTIARERLQELETEYKQQHLDEAVYQQQKAELTEALAIELAAAENTQQQVQQIVDKKLVYGSLFFIIVMALPLYLYLGNTAALDQQAVTQSAQNNEAHTGSEGMVSLDVALANLARKLEQDPTNIKGWHMLGRSYMSMRRFAEAADTYKKLYQLVGDDTEVLLAYADALSMSRGGRLSGEPFKLVQTALKQSPENTMALWLAGLAYSEQGKFDEALKQWQILLPLLQNDPASAEKVKTLIHNAQKKLGIEVTAPVESQVPVVATAAIKVNVSLEKKLLEKAAPTDIVFIYAKAHNGSPMPLAAAKYKVSDLPVSVILDDSSALMPQMKLSSATMVDVAARISKNGAAIAQPGDLEGMIESVKPASGSEVNVVINRIR